MATPNSPRRFYLITYPRTASNLLVRMLALDKQPNFVCPPHNGGYYFMPSFMKSRDLEIREHPPQEWTDEMRQQMMQAFQECFDTFHKYLDDTAAQDKTAFIKEHMLFLLEPSTQAKAIFGEDSVTETPWTVQLPGKDASELTRSKLNETIFPDEFLQSFLPTFLIRNPALSFPSLYRARRDMDSEEAIMAEGLQFEIMLSLKWTREIYDFYAQYLSSSEAKSQSSGSWPVVLDADDVINNPDVLFQFCNLVGLDPDKLRFQWDVATQEQRNAIGEREKRMLSTLSDSTGVDKSKTAGTIDIDAEAKKWKVEFGEQIGSMIESRVREAMPDYEFLRSKRLLPKAQPERTSEAHKEAGDSKASAGSSGSSASQKPEAKQASSKPEKSRFGLLRKFLPCINSAK